MNIKKVSDLTGISADTIRYYERIGLIPHINRNDSGFREFSQNDINILEFVRCFRNAGVSVESLIEYFSLFTQGDHTIPARLDILREEREKLKRKISELQKTLNKLNFKIENYEDKILSIEHTLFDDSWKEESTDDI